jgi:putative spermidine/putrescine transport system substrate-binding protein
MSAGRGLRSRTGLAALLLALLCACQRAPAPSTGSARDPEAPSRAREGVLDLVEVGGAGRNGADWAPAFEAASGCRVRRHLVPDSTGLLALAGSSEADVLLAGGDVAASLVAAGRVRALDPARLGMLASLPEGLRELPGAVVGGVRYGVPVRWQPNVLAYDTRAFAEAPASWSAVLAPAGEATPGLAPAEPVAIADAALYLAAMRPDLRIADPFALDERQYLATLSLLRQRHRNWRGVAREPRGFAEAIANGVTAFAATPAQVRALQAASLPVAWTAPEEGVTAQVELAMLHVQARHPNCAQFWLEWSQSPRAQAQLAARAGALPVRAAACTLEPLATPGACARDGMALLPQAHFWRVPQARCGKRACVPYSRWTRDYFALLGE